MLVCPVLQVSSWHSIRQRLAPGGRVITNLGATRPPDQFRQATYPDVQTTQAALTAMAEAFDGEYGFVDQLAWCRVLYSMQSSKQGRTLCHPPVHHHPAAWFNVSESLFVLQSLLLERVGTLCTSTCSQQLYVATRSINHQVLSWSVGVNVPD